MKYIIQDKTNNSQRNYINELGQPTISENAKRFDSEIEATEFAKECNGNGDWFFVEEVEA